ncbi:MAG TPA: DUF695 domain-containing protein [Puia sp.]|nr:DUF695 domain-containing protein [Puia sp.]
MKIKYTLSVGFLLLSLLSFAQEENWDVYMAQYEKGPGSTLINMSLKATAPIKEYPFLLKTGVKLINCGQEGLPSSEESDAIYAMSDKMKSVIDFTLKSKSAGTFSYQCKRMDYYYVNDTDNIRRLLESAYKKYYPKYEYSIEIKNDPKWEAYLDFLYPNEETMEYMSNSKVVLKLTQAGDDLSKPRQVDHWLYFKNEADRELFIAYASKENYKMEGKKYIEKSPLHFQLQISRMDKVDMISITEITKKLRKKAKELNADYDGWETFVIKDK